MRRYVFRLASVLRVRRNEQDVALAGVLRAQAVAAEQTAALTACDRAYAAALSPQGSRSVAEFVHEQGHRAALAQAVIDQRHRVRRAEDDIEAARAVWSTAASRVGALERLDERQRAEHRVHALREEDLVIDDLVVSRAAGGR